jgi:hypothetical protein
VRSFYSPVATGEELSCTLAAVGADIENPLGLQLGLQHGRLGLPANITAMQDATTCATSYCTIMAMGGAGRAYAALPTRSPPKVTI